MRGVAREVFRRVRATSIVIALVVLVAITTQQRVIAADSSLVDHTGRIALGDVHTCAIHRDDSVWCWGSNSYGQLGLGDQSSVSDVATPQKVPTFGDGATPIEIVAGKFHTCARLNDGSVWCWGRNSSGAVAGDGVVVSAPRRVTLSTTTPSITASALFAGGDNTCALLSDTTLSCWGLNTSGQLGIGVKDNDAHNAPVVVTGTTTTVQVVSMAIGTSHMCATDTDHRVWCWGANANGQSSSGTDAFVLTPAAKTMVGAFGDHVGLGASHSCVGVDDAIACFGLSTSSQAPSAMLLGSTVLDVVAGGNFSCARLAGNTAKCWGSNSDSQLGTGTTSTASRATAEQVTGLDDTVIDISLGKSHACAVLSDGKVQCWGDNDFGQLGLADNDTQHTATAVPLINVVPVVVDTSPSQQIKTGDAPSVEERNLDTPSYVESASPPALVLQNKNTGVPLIQKLRVKKGRSVTAQRIAQAVSLAVPKKSQGKMRISIVKGTGTCRFVGTSIRALRKGTCTVSVSLVPKTGKTLTRKTTITVR